MPSWNLSSAKIIRSQSIVDINGRYFPNNSATKNQPLLLLIRFNGSSIIKYSQHPLQLSSHPPLSTLVQTKFFFEFVVVVVVVAAAVETRTVDMSKGSSSGSKRLSRCIKAPVRVLCSARDWYVRGITAFAGQVGQHRGAGISCPSYTDFTYSNVSFSSSSSSSRSSDDCQLDSDVVDLRQLIRAATPKARSADHAAAKPSMRRSQSAVVVVGRIDEDKPCEFRDMINEKVGSSLLFPRSSSHGLGTKKRRGSNMFA